MHARIRFSHRKPPTVLPVYKSWTRSMRTGGTTKLKKNHTVSVKQKSDVKKRTRRMGEAGARGRFERRSDPVEASDVEEHGDLGEKSIGGSG